MKATYCALAAMLGCVCLAHTAVGQTLKHPASVQSASLANERYNYYGYYDDEEASPSDAPAVVQPPALELAGSDCGSCGACNVCSATGSKYRFGPDEPFKLFPDDPCGGLKIGFWSQIGYHTAGVNGIGTGMMNNYPDRVQLHQQWLYLERAVDTGGDGFDWGYRLDYVYGTDGPDTQAFGGQLNEWDFGWNNGVAYGHAIPQAYLEFGYNNWKAKVGHFYTIEGYEVVPATGNFFYSHSFEFYLSEPFTHTGILLEYAMADDITLLGGWTAGWDTGFTRNGGSNFLGGIQLQLTERLAFSYMTSWGDAGFDDAVGNPGSDQNGYFHTLLFTFDISDRWTYVLQSNYSDNDLLLGSPRDILTLNNYLFYNVSERLAYGGRLEWYRDPRVGIGGASDEIVGLTIGLNYRPAANVVIRPELRWQDFHVDNQAGALFGSAGPLRDTFLFGIDTVITY
jgi:hypothetical protein